MSDKRKKPEKRKPGRPSKYQPEYCELLVEHMAKGYTMEAFGGVIRVSKDTLYKWLNRHKEFADAKKLGEPLQELFYLRMGQSIATGTLRSIKTEKVARLPSGEPIMDPSTGRPVLERTYDTGRANAVAFIWLTKNVCGWRDKRDVNIGGQPNAAPIVTRRQVLTEAERLQEIEQLTRTLRECGED